MTSVPLRCHQNFFQPQAKEGQEKESGRTLPENGRRRLLHEERHRVKEGEHVLRRVGQGEEGPESGQGDGVELVFGLRGGDGEDIGEEERKKPGVLHL